MADHHVDISRSTARRLDKLKRPGESDNDMLTRMFQATPVPRRATAPWPAHNPLAATAIEAVQADKSKPLPYFGENGNATLRGIEDALRDIPAHRRPHVIGEVAKKLNIDLPKNLPPDLHMSITESAQHLRPDQQDRLALALLGKSSELEVHKTIIPFLKERAAEFEADMEPTRTKIADLTLRMHAAEHIAAIAEKPLLGKLGETGFHKCIEAIRNGTIVPVCFPDQVYELTDHDVSTAHSFVVQHDWAQAFAKAEGFQDGEYHLPYDRQVFEFRISGSRVCFSIDAVDGHPTTGGLYVETPVGWAVAALCSADHGVWRRRGASDICWGIIELVTTQVRAVAIALEAEVAVTEVVRAPHKLNAIRLRKGKPPLLDYHLVSLAHRARYAPRLPESGDIETEKTRKRLHFVRAHMRHYANHKVLIKWHLRGNPDLGFVDKEYRL